MIGGEAAHSGIILRNSLAGGEGDGTAAEAQQLLGQSADLGLIRRGGGKIGVFLDLGTDLAHHIGNDGVDFLGGISSKEHAVVFQEDQLGANAGGSLARSQRLHAQHGQGIAGLGIGHPNGIREQPRDHSLAGNGAGDAVDAGGMQVQHELPLQQIMQNGLNTGPAGLAFPAGSHHVGQDLCFTLSFHIGILLGADLRQQGTVHADKFLRLDGSQRGAGALYIQGIAVFIGGVAAACQNIVGIGAVFIGHCCQGSQIFLRHISFPFCGTAHRAGGGQCLVFRYSWRWPGRTSPLPDTTGHCWP